MPRIIQFGVAAAGLLIATAAIADYGYEDDTDYNYDYARVVDVEPIVRYVKKKRPVRECYERDSDAYYEAGYDYDDRYDRHERVDATGPALAGGVIGGLVGRQFGKGRGRDAATVAGALIGAAIGQSKAEARYARRYDDRHYHNEQPARICTTRYESYEEEHIDGYRVTYAFNGQEYTTRMRQPPGDEIRVSVNVSPVASY